jgi:hypothetical protein
MMQLDEYVRAMARDIDCASQWDGGQKQLQLIGLDVKYNQLRCAAPVFNDLRERPFLLEYFWRRGIRVVHVIRRNLLHTALSMQIANQRQVWHNKDGSLIQGRYKVDPGELLCYMRWIRDECEEFQRLTHDSPVRVSVYEDLVDDLARVNPLGDFQDDTKTLASLAEFLNVPNQFSVHRTLHKAVNKPYAEIIENYDELLGAVAASEFSEFAKAA